MAARVLVAYGSKRGSTREVAEAVAATLREHGDEVDVEPAGRARELVGYDGVVLGGALYRGRWHGGARRFLKRQRRSLSTVPVAAFAMGPRRNEEAAFERSRLQLERALAKAPEVKPTSPSCSAASIASRGSTSATGMRFACGRRRSATRSADRECHVDDGRHVFLQRRRVVRAVVRDVRRNVGRPDDVLHPISRSVRSGPRSLLPQLDRSLP
jgi:menaquinone-dependent protoporphyrinogen oxidase